MHMPKKGKKKLWEITSTFCPILSVFEILEIQKIEKIYEMQSKVFVL